MSKSTGGGKAYGWANVIPAEDMYLEHFKVLAEAGHPDALAQYLAEKINPFGSSGPSGLFGRLKTQRKVQGIANGVVNPPLGNLSPAPSAPSVARTTGRSRTNSMGAGVGGSLYEEMRMRMKQEQQAKFQQALQQQMLERQAAIREKEMRLASMLKEKEAASKMQRIQQLLKGSGGGRGWQEQIAMAAGAPTKQKLQYSTPKWQQISALGGLF